MKRRKGKRRAERTAAGSRLWLRLWLRLCLCLCLELLHLKLWQSRTRRCHRLPEKLCSLPQSIACTYVKEVAAARAPAAMPVDARASALPLGWRRISVR